MIITIGREFGSNGHKVGELVAHKLGIKLYDKVKLAEEAKKTNRYKDELKAFYEEQPVNSLLYVIATNSYSSKQGEVPFEFIRQVAAKEPCVIIGRCGNYVFRDNPEATNVFIHASEQYRVNRVAKELGVSISKAERKVEEEDKTREGFHTYYADEKWNNADGYDLTIDVSRIGEEAAADLIIQFAKMKQEGRK